MANVNGGTANASTRAAPLPQTKYFALITGYAKIDLYDGELYNRANKGITSQPRRLPV